MKWADDTFASAAVSTMARGKRALDRRPLRSRRGQQAAAGHRRERHGAEQLGVVAAAGAMQRIGPGMVEHELAARMRLEIKRRRADQLSRACHARARGAAPSRCAARRSRKLPARFEEIPVEERVVGLARRIGDRVPCRAVDLAPCRRQSTATVRSVLRNRRPNSAPPDRSEVRPRRTISVFRRLCEAGAEFLRRWALRNRSRRKFRAISVLRVAHRPGHQRQAAGGLQRPWPETEWCGPR